MNIKEKTKKKSIKIRYKNRSWLYSAFITSGIMILIMYINRIIPFGDYTLAKSDCMAQYIPFFSEYRNKLINCEGILFSWNVGMGTDFFLIFEYYLASPLNLLIVFFEKTELHTFLSLIIFLKVVLSSSTMAFYLSKKEENSNPVINCAFAVSYALSSYVLGYFWNVMWLDAFLIFPIIIYGMDKLMKYGKPAVYILSLAYAIFSNYYISFMICNFLVLWFFHYEFKGYKDFIKKGIRFAFCSVLSAGITFITVYVAFCGMKTFVSSAESFPDNQLYSSFFNILRNMYFLSKPINMSTNRSDANVYAGLLPVVLLFVLPLVKGIKIKEKLYRMVQIAVLILSMNSSVLNYIWHGFHEQNDLPNRFSFIFVFVLIDTAYIVTNNLESIKKKYLIPMLFFAICMPIIIFVFVDFNGIYSSVTTVLLGVVLSAVYSILIVIYTYLKEKHNLFYFVIGSIAIVEISVNSVISFNNTELFNASYYMTYVDARQKSIEKAKELSNDDCDFYREEVSPWIFMDENVYHNIHSVGLFSSTVGGRVIESMDALGYNSGIFGFYLYNDSIPMMDDILGIKYIHSYSNSIDDKYYKKVFSVEGGDVLYENKDSLPLGFGVNKGIYDLKSFESYNGASNQSIAMSLATGIDDLYEEVHPEYSIAASTGEVCIDNGKIKISNISSKELSSQVVLYGEFNIQKDGDYFIQFHNYKIDEVNININDLNYFYDEKYCGMLRLGELKQGDKVSFQLVLIAESIGENGIPIYVSTINKDKLDDINSVLSKSKLSVSEYGSNYMKGSFSLEKDQILFLSIPYNEGWRIKVDGKKIDPDIVMGAFTGINSEAGNHTIELEYIPQGYAVGIAGTIVSWVIFICYLLILQKDRKKNTNES